jgi:hypothetical protein
MKTLDCMKMNDYFFIEEHKGVVRGCIKKSNSKRGILSFPTV